MKQNGVCYFKNSNSVFSWIKENGTIEEDNNLLSSFVTFKRDLLMPHMQEERPFLSARKTNYFLRVEFRMVKSPLILRKSFQVKLPVYVEVEYNTDKCN